MRPALMHSVREVLDMDASIKPLYGRQEGTQLARFRLTHPMCPTVSVAIY